MDKARSKQEFMADALVNVQRCEASAERHKFSAGNRKLPEPTLQRRRDPLMRHVTWREVPWTNKHSRKVAGSPHFTHISEDDFRVVRDNMLGGKRVTTGRQVPFCLFTDPEFARVG
jgi:hypothetical protein